MGVKDLNPVLADLGFEREQMTFGPGHKLHIDAMMQLYTIHAKLEPEFVPRTSYSGYNDLKVAAMSAAQELTWDQCFMPDSRIRFEALAADVGRPEIWIKMRERLAHEMFLYVMKLKAGGMVPIIVWDGSVYGRPPFAPKLPRPPNKLLLRRVDILYIYACLRASGVASVVADNEGERFAAMAARGMPGSIVVSRDTDCIALGAPFVAESVIPVVGKGVIANEVASIAKLSRILAQFRSEYPSQVLTSMALFLGCDFSARKRGNGPKTLVKLLASPLPLYSDPEATDSIRFFTVTPEEIADATARAQVAIDASCKPNMELVERLGFMASFASAGDMPMRDYWNISNSSSAAAGASSSDYVRPQDEYVPDDAGEI
jgi:hypothetical protein